VDLSLTAERFRSASRRRVVAALLWISLVLAGVCPTWARHELALAWGLLVSLWFLRCVEWRTARNARFTREWVFNAWREALATREKQIEVALSLEAPRRAPRKSLVASPGWLAEVAQAEALEEAQEARAERDVMLQTLESNLAGLAEREKGILALRQVTVEFRGEAWLIGLAGFTCALAGLAGWARGGGALAGCVLLMAVSYRSHTAKATALGGP